VNNENSRKLTPVWDKYYPGGHTNFRTWPSDTRTFANRSKGSHVWDIDGNEYIEYTGAMGPNIIGSRHPEYVSSLKEFLDQQAPLLGSAQLCSPDDIDVAEKLVKHIPCAEAIKFNLSGSDCVQMAIRLSRAHTGRKYFIRFTGHYHGWPDNVYGGKLNPDPDAKPFPLYDPDPVTDPSGLRGRSEFGHMECFLLPYNDFESLERTVEKYHEEIALIHLEGIVCNHFNFRPKPGYLEKIRELCTKYGIVMSIDEVITGFRIGLNGAQGYLNVTPDLATFGKAIAGGMPVAALAGKSEILNEMADRTVLGPGTFNGYPLGMRATLTTLKILERNDGEAFRAMENMQKPLVRGFTECAKRHGFKVNIQSIPGVIWYLFGVETDGHLYTDDDIKNFDGDLQHKFWIEMEKEGVMIMRGGRMYLSIAHTLDDVGQTIEAIDKVMGRL